ncbi:MAG: M48 family metallopeptidase [Phycisphaeraceae bacterium]
MSQHAAYATMDFFGQQSRMRRRTLLLIVLMALAVLLITALTYPVVAFVAAWMGPHGGGENRTADWPKLWESMWQLEMVLGVGAGILLLISGAALLKVRSLARGGGAGVAASLGGKRLAPETEDPAERQLLNVVEEMSIASGMNVPPVYVMNEENTINAFAAGFTPDDAVVGITRGAIDHLDRDELQGVIAHEFSHILNGDMRMNIRLTGIIHGLMVIAIIGYGILRSAFYASAVGSRRSSSDDGKGKLVALLIGALLVAIGSVGVLFGRVIKAAVSRQREFLADAAAVQFTRNPAGLSGALRKIGGTYRQARLKTAKAEEASHMFIGNAVLHMPLLDSHPALKSRIRQIDPKWDGSYTKITTRRYRQSTKAPDHADPQGQSMAGAGMADAIVGGAVIAGTLAERVAASQAADRRLAQQRAKAQRALAQIGQPSDAHLDHARKLREAIPEQVAAAVHEPGGSRAVVYALLLDADSAIRSTQLKRLEHHAEPTAYAATQQLATSVMDLGDELRLVLIELAMPALRELTAEQYAAFKTNMTHLIHADGRVSIFEWMIERVVEHHLEPTILGTPRPRTRYYSLKPLSEQLACLLTMLAYTGAASDAEAEQAFATGAALLKIDRPKMWSKIRCGLDELGEALDRLAETGLRQKQTVLNACAACIAADGVITTREAELLRAVSANLDIPMPPLLPGQPLT